MTAIIMLALAIVTFKLAERLLALLADGIAIAVAAWYCWRSARLARALLAVRAPCNAIDLMPAWDVSRAHRRLIARHLRVSIAMTTHFDLFPRSSARGYAMMKAFGCVVA